MTQQSTEQAEAATFIPVELRGGPLHGQTMNVPRDEFYLKLFHDGKPYAYSRFNDQPIFRHEDEIVSLLGGAR